MSRARLGLDSFSYHRWFGETNQWEEPLEVRWTTGDLLEHVASIGVEALSLQTIHLDDRTPANLSRIGTGLAEAGVECILAWGHRSGLEDGQSEEKLGDALRAMDMALALGCRLMRVVCGDQYSWSSDPKARSERRARLRGPLTSIAKQAELVGLVIAVENHADATATEVAKLVETIDPVHLGTCFDLGNAVRVGEDPVKAAAATLPYCEVAHLRDLKIQDASRGDPTAWWPCVALGEGDLPIPSVLEQLVSAPRCSTWLVEISNVLPGRLEPDLAETSLAYLRDWLSGSEPSLLA
jgi:3-oxoisoapionate decarboxylase